MNAHKRFDDAIEIFKLNVAWESLDALRSLRAKIV